ncbi:mitogen-activated protein kinase kinase kinase 20-like [Mercurialis annua]|uniref:mitogen-activated protein kinase kinase kinase 20-like n=1 Tax=Mercurialis annua TaxID=3986 RepID=UPI00215FFDDA|nr:mitogen-activated protein kinase kinase kinase 20-like [Mercurialis annua]
MDYLRQLFRVDSIVEINIRDTQYYPAKILQLIGDGHTYKVQYLACFADQELTTPLISVVPVSAMRPLPPLLTDRTFKVQDIVDVMLRGNWIKGCYIATLRGPPDQYVVFVPEHGNIFSYQIRFHGDWLAFPVYGFPIKNEHGKLPGLWVLPISLRPPQPNVPQIAAAEDNHMRREMNLATEHQQDEAYDNSGATWWRRELLGQGAYASVYLATSRNQMHPLTMAVKSALVSKSSSLQREKQIYDNLNGSSPYVIQCYGEETTSNNKGETFYNLLLEYASGGTLCGHIDRLYSYGGRLPESDVKRFTKCILEGIYEIHRHGYVHCDLKPQNVLLVSTDEIGVFVPKIADFGLAKQVGDPDFMGGTLMYMAPETATDDIQDCDCDIWALGCIVYEMLAGSPLWYGYDSTTNELKTSIAYVLPGFPCEISTDARNFLGKCLDKNKKFRWSAEMLLNHAFVDRIHY